MRVAIVGAGVSGLVTAWLLHRHHEVTVFEAADYAGGHTNTIDVDVGGRTLPVDTGFIVYNDRNYPNFERLLQTLGVPSQPSSMGFSVADATGSFEYSSTSAAGLFATRRHLVDPSFHRMLLDVRRFQLAARKLLEADGGDASLGEWLERQRFSRQFVERLIVPQVSAVWSAPPAQRWSFPARFLAEFFDNHGMLSLRGRPQWRVVSGGSRRYVEALTSSLEHRVRLGTPATSVGRHDDHVTIATPGRDPERFDEVVFATHADQALALLADASAAERQILSAIPYQRNDAVLHTDRRLLPRRSSAWASWNYHLREELDGPPAVTYHMNTLQSLTADVEVCVTLNCTERIDPGKVIRKISYAHPIFTHAGLAAQRRVSQISGRNRTSYCGAYWGWGFHEDGVVSALRVAERFGARL